MKITSRKCDRVYLFYNAPVNYEPHTTIVLVIIYICTHGTAQLLRWLVVVVGAPFFSRHRGVSCPQRKHAHDKRVLDGREAATALLPAERRGGKKKHLHTTAQRSERLEGTTAGGVRRLRLQGVRCARQRRVQDDGRFFSITKKTDN